MHGVTFNVNEEGEGACHVFNPDRPEATDRGPAGMVAEMTRFVELSKDKRSLLDVGALFGVFSMVFCALTGGTAYAIEASPWAFPILMDHVRANPTLDFGHGQFFLGDTPYREVNCARDWKHVIANLDRPDSEQITIYEARLDDILPAEYFVDIMKIDVEAYEVQVLRGAENLIRRCRPLMFIELHTATLPDNGESLESFMALMDDYGYTTRNYDGSLANDILPNSMTRVIAWP